MKNVLGITVSIIGIILIIIGSILKLNNNTISIIGGADGPTSVFVATKLNSAPITILMIIGMVMLIVAIFFFLKKK